jgi:hypothetical protein
MKTLRACKLSSLVGGKIKKKTSSPVEPIDPGPSSDNKTETLTLKCHRRGTSPETVEFIKNIVVYGLDFVLFPFTQL